MNERNANITPWTPEWLRTTSPSAVVAMAEVRQRSEQRDASRRTRS